MWEFGVIATKNPGISTITGAMGGGQGIRTLGAIADTLVFKTNTFGHSVSPPEPTLYRATAASKINVGCDKNRPRP